MSPELIGLIGIIVMLILVFMRFWVGSVMAIVGLVGYAYLEGWGKALKVAGIEPFAHTSSYILAAVPMFIFMGLVISHTGLGSDLYRAASVWLGRVRGGLAMASVVATGVFAAVCGDSVATATTIGKVAFPEMKKFNYDSRLAAGCLAAGGTIGIMIPPSLGFILYGLLTEQSIGQLFIAGIIPGILQVLFYVITIALLCRFNPNLAPLTVSRSLSFKEKVVETKYALAVAGIIVFVIGGIYLGLFTATEAGALGSFGAIIAAAVARKATKENLKSAILEGTQTAGMIAFMVVGVFLFTRFMAVSRAPNALTDFVVGTGLPPMAVLGLIIVMYLILGCIMDVFAAIILTLPFVYPTILACGFDPIWFGVLMVRLMEIGLITPPIGLNCFVLSASIGVPTTTVFRGIFPFVIADIVHVGLLIAYPELALYLVK
ncbi:MAG: TRAP transporter large permease [Moorellales bacterium]